MSPTALHGVKIDRLRRLTEKALKWNAPTNRASNLNQLGVLEGNFNLAAFLWSNSASLQTPSLFHFPCHGREHVMAAAWKLLQPHLL